VWSRLCSEVTVVEFLNSIGGVGIDEEISCVPFIVQSSVLLPTDACWRLRKQFKKSLTKHQAEHKGSPAEKKDGKVVVTTEAAMDGKQETVRSSHILLSSLPAGT
jgi:dihydrolipoamide dehydrogenase